MSRSLAALALLVAALTAAPAHARRGTNQLVRVLAPVHKQAASAHPFVNVIVRFGQAADGTPADPSTFGARIGQENVTDRFTPVTENGRVAGMQGAIEPRVLRLGKRNRLQVDVRSVRRTNARPARFRDVDRLRFKAVETENQPPEVLLGAPGDILIPGVAMQFDASGSHDPESDPITFAWEFSEGDPSSEEKPTRTFSGDADVTVRLTVSDGQTSASQQVTLVRCPAVDAARTPGLLKIEAAQALDFAAVAPGSSAPRTFTVRNPDADLTSQLRVHLQTNQPDFTLDPPTLDLGPGESAPVTLTFAPGAEGHRSADVVVVASARNRCAVHLLAHGYGGTAPGTGPTQAGTPVFFNQFGLGTGGILPGGARFTIDNFVNSCQNTGDMCIVDADCAANGGGSCLSTPERLQLFDPIDMCSDGEGSVFLISDDGTYTDPTPGEDERSTTIMRIDVDQNGARTRAEILDRVNSGTTQIGCDAVAASAGGRIYAAEFRTVSPEDCFRSEQEALLSLRKNTGASDVVLPRIDAAEGYDACEDDIDETVDLNVTADGVGVFASLSDGGLWQLRPSFRLISPTIYDVFQLHPDGDIIYVTATDTGASGLLSVYKISPEQAATGAPPIFELTPCAVFPIPNNRTASDFGRTGIGEHSYAVGRVSPGSLDGTVLVSFFTTGGLAGANAPLSLPLRIQGTVAFSAPAGSATCSVLGLVNLDLVDQLTF